jgi:hypothetical protein
MNLMPMPPAITAEPPEAPEAPETPESPATPATPDTTADEPQTVIGVPLYMIHLTIRAPSGKVKCTNAEIRAALADGQLAEVGRKQMTAPSYRIDIDPAWTALRHNEQAIRRCVSRFCVSTHTDAQYLVTRTRVAPMRLELNELIGQRVRLAERMAERWRERIVPDLKRFHGEHFWAIRPKLPAPAQLVDRFSVSVRMTPLADLNAEDLVLDELGAEDADAIRRQAIEEAKLVQRERVQLVMDQVFGELLSVCREINSGGLDKARKSGFLTHIMDVLARVDNFAEYANPRVLRQVRQARDFVGGIDSVSELNRNETVREGIRAAFTPLADSVRKLKKQTERGSGRSRRAIEV